MKYALFFCCWLLATAAHAQETTLSGQVFDNITGRYFPGVTVLQLGTTNGTVTDSAGRFKFKVLGSVDSILLRVSAIGFVSQQRWVGAGGYPVFRLKQDTFKNISTMPRYARFGFSITSGLRYAPVGAQVILYGQQIHIPLSITANYQTNFGRNYALMGRIDLPKLYQINKLSVFGSLKCQQLQTPLAGLHFRSYMATIGGSIYRIGSVRMPQLLLGAGYAERRPLDADAPAASDGYGYSIAVQHTFLRYPFRMSGYVRATHWPSYWQWQGSLARNVALYYDVSASLNLLPRYTEVSLSLSRFFY